MWSDDRHPAAAPTLAGLSQLDAVQRTHEDGEAEDIQETAEAAFAASSQRT
jgi:hypothetical protein